MPQSAYRKLVFVLLTIGLAAGPFSASSMLAQSMGASGSGQTTPTGPALNITMDQAVSMALEQNLGLQADRLGPALAAQDAARARSVYNPTLFTNYSRNDVTRPAGNVFEASGDVSTNTNTVQGGVAQALRWFGSQYQVSWTAGRVETTAFSSFNPQLSSNISLTFNQPLLRGLLIDANRANLQTVARQQQIADVELTNQIGQTERTTRLAYLALISAIKGREVAEQNLEVARAQYRNTRARVEVGVSAEADIVGPEAEVSQLEESLIVAESNIESQMDQLRQLVLDPSRPDYWTVRLVPTETITVEEPHVNVDAAVQSAMAGRVDLVQARKQLEVNDINIRLLNSLKLPAVDFRVNYQGSGTAGTLNDYSNDLPPVITNQTVRPFSTALSDTFHNAYPSWTYGVQVSYPLGKSDTDANLARARIAKKQGETQLRELELLVATQVRDAARQVETAYRRVQASRASLTSQERRLEAENKRFEVGLSNNFTLLQIQRDVANARVQALNAELAYSRALIQFEAVQKIR
jgi:outer membrane protein TolC